MAAPAIADQRKESPLRLLDHRDIGQRRRGRGCARRRIILVEPVDQLGDFLERADELDDPVGVISFRPELGAHPLADEGFGGFPHVDVGIERGGDALVHHHRLLQQQQVRLDLHVEIAGDREQAFEHSADRNLLDRKAADRLAGGPQGGREFLDIVVRRNILRFEVDFGDPAVIAGDQAVEDLRQPHPRPAIDPAHDPEVDRARSCPSGRANRFP